jgi:thiol-disulfide isomerase/thioredoxin
MVQVHELFMSTSTSLREKKFPRMVGMFLAALLLSAVSKLVQITKDNVNLIGGPSPMFVTFYKPQDAACERMAVEFEDAAPSFDNVTFGRVDCHKSRGICRAHAVREYPSIRLFYAGDSKGTGFFGARTFESFREFVETYTGLRAKAVRRPVAEIDPAAFAALANSSACAIILFSAHGCHACKEALLLLREVAGAFAGDEGRVEFAKWFPANA